MRKPRNPVIKAYKAKSYAEKLNELLNYFGNSSKLAHNLEVSRTSIVRWQDNPDQIRPEHRLDIDVAYCDALVMPVLDKAQPGEPSLVPDEYTFKTAKPYLQKLSYGTYEIEDPEADPESFKQMLNSKKLPKGITRERFLGMFNSWMVNKELFERFVVDREPIKINERLVRQLHRDLMRGIRDDAGSFAEKIRVMGKLEGIETTAPEDIPAEVAYWSKKYGDAETVTDIAKSHAHFVLIHPFGDSNGRVGRALMFIQFFQAGLLPPVLNSENQALYYSTLAYAMKHGRHTPLIHLLVES